MGQVTSTAEWVIAAPVATVRPALADYAEGRPRILTSQFSGYRVESGGHGAGTRARWQLAATKKRGSLPRPGPLGRLLEGGPAADRRLPGVAGVGRAGP
jgi:hypothetical protein